MPVGADLRVCPLRRLRPRRRGLKLAIFLFLLSPPQIVLRFGEGLGVGSPPSRTPSPIPIPELRISNYELCFSFFFFLFLVFPSCSFVAFVVRAFNLSSPNPP